MNDIIVDETGLPLKFPDYRDVIRADAEAFRRLPPDERMKYLQDVIQTGWYLSRISPNRQIEDELFLKREAEWQRFQREIFDRELANGRDPSNLA
jgi:hypothetical protein